MRKLYAYETMLGEVIFRTSEMADENIQRVPEWDVEKDEVDYESLYRGKMDQVIRFSQKNAKLEAMVDASEKEFELIKNYLRDAQTPSSTIAISVYNTADQMLKKISAMRDEE